MSMRVKCQVSSVKSQGMSSHCGLGFGAWRDVEGLGFSFKVLGFGAWWDVYAHGTHLCQVSSLGAQEVSQIPV